MSNSITPNNKTTIVNNNNSSKNTKFISKSTIKRLISDVRYIKKNPLKSNNILYSHDNENILKGYACIIGYKDTPYEGGYYIFEFNFPEDYPHSPPVIKFIYDNSCRTRFNPNLYTNGKVCLSILNTWLGDAWSGCQTISSTLLSISTIFNDKPLLNEPGVSKYHKDFDTYNQIITYKNFEISILKNLNSEFIKNNLNELYEYMINDFMENYDNIFKNLLNKKENYNKFIKHNKTTFLKTNIYNMNYKINYDKLIDKIILLHLNLSNK
jgi:ubiquitin-conjugating enzyme E2 Z